MSKNKSGRAEKIQRREEAKKKAGQKRIMTIIGGIVAAAVVLTFIALLIYRQGGERPDFGENYRHEHSADCRH
jgi:hypothetical protein